MINEHNVFKERDNILEGILTKIQNSEELRNDLVVCGGGALHFFYSSPRYSGDIDTISLSFDITKNALMEKLIQNIEANDKIYTPKLKKLTNSYMRVSYSDNIPNSVCGRIEIDKYGNIEKHKKSCGKFSPILVEEPTEIYCGKIIATLGRMNDRGSIKGSDLFDLDYIQNTLNANPTEKGIVEKAQSFMLNGWTKKNMDKVIDYIGNKENHGEFIRTLKRSMNPEFYETQKFDNNFFEKSTEHFRKYRHLMNGTE